MLFLSVQQTDPIFKNCTKRINFIHWPWSMELVVVGQPTNQQTNERMNETIQRNMWAMSKLKTRNRSNTGSFCKPPLSTHRFNDDDDETDNKLNVRCDIWNLNINVGGELSCYELGEFVWVISDALHFGHIMCVSIRMKHLHLIYAIQSI